jgi:Mitochondrial protein Pet127
MQTKDFVMRSQLDCQDQRLPGTGVFDIKTRACLSLRMDILNYEVPPAAYLIRAVCANCVHSPRKIQGI